MLTEFEHLRRALDASPENDHLVTLWGDMCLHHLLFDEARASFQRVLDRSPQNLTAQLGLARTAYQEGNLSEAVVRAEAMAKYSTDGEVWLLLSRLAFVEGDYALSRDHYGKARELDSAIKDEGLEKNLAAELGAGAARKKSPPPARQTVPPPVPENRAKDPEPKETEPSLEVEFERPTVKFADVGGMEAVKEEIRMKIIYPLQNNELFRRYGKKTGGGVLMYGPPGCGKTLLARATAGEIAATFLTVGIHQVLDMWIGNSEKNLHKIFDQARKCAPSILFFDEVDALASDRSTMKHSGGRNVINQFLAEMDGANGSNEGVLVLGATNAPWQVDSAFRRPGRFDRVLFLPPPDEAARFAIIKLIARGKPVFKLDALALARQTKDFSGADLAAVFDLATEEKLAVAMREKRMVPILTDDLIRAARSLRPSTRPWFENARNYALYANESGLYDDVLSFLEKNK